MDRDISHISAIEPIEEEPSTPVATFDEHAIFYQADF